MGSSVNALVSAVLLTMSATNVSAQPVPTGPSAPVPPAPDESPAAAPTMADLGRIVEQLRSPQPDQVREAIDLLSVLDRPEVVAPLATLLRSGPPDTITDRALEALGGLAQPSAIEVLTELTHHRRANARRRAYDALTAIGTPPVQRVIEQGLSDSERTIRGGCALSLGQIGARGSLNTLFRAFERGVVEAAISIGKLGNAEAVTRFNAHLGRQALAIMLSGYGEFLRRSDIPAAVKTDIVARLGEVSGPMVRRFLSEYLGSFPRWDRNSPLRRQVDETIRRIPEGPVAQAAPTAAATPVMTSADTPAGTP